MNANELLNYLNERIAYWWEVYENPEEAHERTIALAKIYALEDVLSHVESSCGETTHDK